MNLFVQARLEFGNNNNSLFDPIMKNTIRNTILENKLRYGHPKNHQGLSRLDDLS